MNLHTSIFPKLIDLFNRSPKKYYDYLYSFCFSRKEAKEILTIVNNWIIETNYHTYLNDH